MTERNTAAHREGTKISNQETLRADDDVVVWVALEATVRFRETEAISGGPEAGYGEEVGSGVP